MARIPPALIGTAAPILAEAYTHAELNSLFLAAGFPGDPPEGNKIHKCQDWMRRANAHLNDPLRAFGHLLAEFLDSDAEIAYAPLQEARVADRERLKQAIQREGLSYQRGGAFFGSALTGPSRSLGDRLQREGVPALELEYQRAYAQIEHDPPAALTAACAILEATCKAYLTSHGQALPSKQVLSALWQATAAHLGLSPKDVADLDLKQILSGLSSIATGVAALRTHKGSAHGHFEAPVHPSGRTYRLLPRHVRLAVHAAHTMALFVLETWEAKRVSVEQDD